MNANQRRNEANMADLPKIKKDAYDLLKARKRASVALSYLPLRCDRSPDSFLASDLMVRVPGMMFSESQTT
jgi:hypothetical protein